MNIKPIEIEIARTGTATATNGKKVYFTERMLSDAANCYNPQVFQAPLIITHDTKGVPDHKLVYSPFAYGRPDYLRKVGDRLKAVFTQKIDPQILDWFSKGNLLGVSPSFYPPNHPFNPTPGKYHLRHIAALGKEPPSMKGLQPVSFSEVDDDVLDFMLPPDAALDFSCACGGGDSSDPAVVSLLIGVREYLIADKGLDVANQFVPQPAIERARAELSEAQALAMDVERMSAEEAIEELEEEATEDEGDYVDPYPVYSYQENPTPPKVMKTATKKRHSKEDEMIDTPLNEDASILDEMEDFDLDDEDDEDEEGVKPAKKGKAKAKSDDYSEVANLRRVMARQLRAMEANFSERLSEVESNFERDLEAQSADFAEQREDLERQLADQALQSLAQQAEVEAMTNEYQEAQEQSRLERIVGFVDGLTEQGVPPYLTGEIPLDYAEAEDGSPATWELTDFLASLDEVGLEFAEKLISSFADALVNAESAVNYSESYSSGSTAPVSVDPAEQLGLKVPKGAKFSPEMQEKIEACLEYAEANHFSYDDPGDRRTILNAVFR